LYTTKVLGGKWNTLNEKGYCHKQGKYKADYLSGTHGLDERQFNVLIFGLLNFKFSQREAVLEKHEHVKNADFGHVASEEKEERREFERNISSEQLKK
jgi:hypothetical protein